MRDLKVGVQCIKCILRFETWQHKAYDDGYGYVTIGVGNRKSKPKPNTTISSELVWDLFVADLKDVEAVVDSLVKVELLPHQYDALVSFTFNVGSSAFKNSTMLKRINEGKFIEAAKQFDRWVNVKGVKSNGLVKRRQLERSLFEGVQIT